MPPTSMAHIGPGSNGPLHSNMNGPPGPMGPGPMGPGVGNHLSSSGHQPPPPPPPNGGPNHCGPSSNFNSPQFNGLGPNGPCPVPNSPSNCGPSGAGLRGQSPSRPGSSGPPFVPTSG